MFHEGASGIAKHDKYYIKDSQNQFQLTDEFVDTHILSRAGELTGSDGVVQSGYRNQQGINSIPAQLGANISTASTAAVLHGSDLHKASTYTTRGSVQTGNVSLFSYSPVIKTFSD